MELKDKLPEQKSCRIRFTEYELMTALGSLCIVRDSNSNRVIKNDIDLKNKMRSLDKVIMRMTRAVKRMNKS